MRILQVLHSYPTIRLGGVELLTYHLCQELAGRHEVSVFFPCSARDLSGHAPANHRIQTFPVVVQPGRAQVLSGYRFVLTESNEVERAFASILSRVAPDLVHFQHLLGLPLSLPEIALQRTRVVVTLNDFWLLCPTTHFLDKDGRLCSRPPTEFCLRCVSAGAFRGLSRRIRTERWESTPLHASLGNAYARTFALLLGRGVIDRRDRTIKSILERSDAVTAISHEIVRKAREQANLPAETIDRIQVISPGIDAQQLTQGKALNPAQIVFGYVGHKEERKGLHVLIRAFQRLDAGKAELRIYGKTDAKSGYVRRLLSLAAENSAIRFMGEFDLNGANPYAEMDVLVVPSIAYEGFGLVVSEALHARIPVIASDIGALNESIKDGVNGWLFKPGDAEDLATKLGHVIAHPHLIAETRAQIAPPKSIRQYAEEMERIYTAALQRPALGRASS